MPIMACDDGMFQLEEEIDGLWYHSGIDGSIFIVNHKKAYSNDHFCVDYHHVGNNKTAKVGLGSNDKTFSN